MAELRAGCSRCRPCHDSPQHGEVIRTAALHAISAGVSVTRPRQEISIGTGGIDSTRPRWSNDRRSVNTSRNDALGQLWLAPARAVRSAPTVRATLPSSTDGCLDICRLEVVVVAAATAALRGIGSDQPQDDARAAGRLKATRRGLIVFYISFFFDGLGGVPQIHGEMRVQPEFCRNPPRTAWRDEEPFPGLTARRPRSSRLIDQRDPDRVGQSATVRP